VISIALQQREGRVMDSSAAYLELPSHWFVAWVGYCRRRVYTMDTIIAQLARSHKRNPLLLIFLTQKIQI